MLVYWRVPTIIRVVDLAKKIKQPDSRSAVDGSAGLGGMALGGREEPTGAGEEPAHRC